MLLRWLILHVCVTHAELKLVMRVVADHGRFAHATGDAKKAKLDKRIARNARLAFLVGVLTVHAENPRLVAAAVVAVPTATVLLALRVTGLLR
ncbi:MAG: hypothetical protein EPN57_27010 [Paraburkholderia sp.]|nr:MAG: hypothetical protein EPN57_27010 [Paraburkholderia sp.]